MASARRLLAAMLLVLSGMLPFADDTQAADRLVRVGVLAHRGKEDALRAWTPTAHYLSAEIPGHNFVIVPLTNDDIGPAVEYRDVEFVLTNPGSYAELEFLYGITRIATLKSHAPTGGLSRFGAVIFTRADRRDIRTLTDLRGKRFMAVHPNAFGGWWLAWRELKRQGIEPTRDLRALHYSGFPQDQIVFAVRDGQVDAGTVRTGLLESLALEGKIKLRDFHVLNARHVENFPYALSTELYPDWAFAVLRHTPDDLAQLVAIALLKMPPNHPAAQAGGYYEWTVPLDYHNVHQLMMELGVGPYGRYGRPDYAQLARRYWGWLAALALVVIALAAAYVYTLHMNRRLRAIQHHLEAEIARRQAFEQALQQARDELEQRVAERTAELKKINEELESRVAHRTGQLLAAMQKLEAGLRIPRNGQ
ncbi:PhnD/SsuA/transferrin family substrate-binding protein [Thiobacter aerophilum]|uniref:PhnD/SsuA/transferrin family substrate-binding protein n=1 Tax=Thiobacter aerophilum TaxID=3121275 RepID=A0ABV0EB08_9BURK